MATRKLQDEQDTQMIFEGKFLIAKVLHSTIANGWVKSIDISAAENLPGVLKIATCTGCSRHCISYIWPSLGN